MPISAADLCVTLVKGRKYAVNFCGQFVGTVASQEEYEKLAREVIAAYTEPLPDDCLIVETDE